MLKFIFVLWCLMLSSVSIFGQTLESDLRKSFSRFNLVKINNGKTLRRVESGKPFEIQIDGKSFQFLLKPNDVRSADYKAEFTDNDGRHSLPRSQIYTYQGVIIGEANSLAALTIDGTKTEGYFATASEGFFIESAKNYSSRAGRDDQVIYRVKDKVERDDNICGLDEAVASGMKVADSSADFNAALKPQINRRILKIATEADKEFVQEEILGNGDPAKANAHILSVMNQVDAVYKRDLNLRIVVTFQHAWMPGAADPYAGLSNLPLLTAFKNYWNASFPASNFSYRRDIAHLFTRKSTPGESGRAYESGTVCNPEMSYSYTSSLRFDKWIVVAHEFGHNLNAVHTDQLLSVPPDCVNTIMQAYPAPNNPTQFCPYSINEMTAFINTSGSCLESDPTAGTRTLFDFDGDGKTDISVFRPSNGYWYASKSSGGFSSIQWGLGTDTLVPGDYDGDGRTDLAVYRRGIRSINPPRDADNIWYILKSSDNTFLARPLGITNGSTFDVAVPADYDGDGKIDLAVYTQQDFAPSPGFFTVLQSSTDTRVVTQWGLNSDVLAPADYDGDGRADYAVFRRESGTWYILQSSNGAVRIEYFGVGTDRIVPGDYDGDGRADIAVWRPSNGYWYRINSNDKSFNSIQFGLPDDKPTPGDYDGDGKTDVGVFRPSNGMWYLQQSSRGFRAEQFGLSSDVPIPNVFVRY